MQKHGSSPKTSRRTDSKMLGFSKLVAETPIGAIKETPLKTHDQEEVSFNLHKRQPV